MSNQKTRLHRLLNLPDFLKPERLGYASIEVMHEDGTVTVFPSETANETHRAEIMNEQQAAAAKAKGAA